MLLYAREVSRTDTALQKNHWLGCHAARGLSAPSGTPPSHIHLDRQRTSLDILLDCEAQRAARIINEHGPHPGPIMALNSSA